MDTTIFPARAGIENLYWRRSRCSASLSQIDEGGRDFAAELYNGHPGHPLDELPNLFTGRRNLRENRECMPCAGAISGVCFFLNTLLNLSSNPEECSLVHVIPGRVEWDEKNFQDVYDFEVDYSMSEDYQRIERDRANVWYEAQIGPTMRSDACANLRDSSSADITCDLIVEERAHSGKSLFASYNFDTAYGQFSSVPVKEPAI